MNSISPNLNIMIKACEKAAKVIRDFGEIENYSIRKGPKDFVTKTDMRVERILIEGIKSKKIILLSPKKQVKY